MLRIFKYKAVFPPPGRYARATLFNTSTQYIIGYTTSNLSIKVYHITQYNNGTERLYNDSGFYEYERTDGYFLIFKNVTFENVLGMYTSYEELQ